MTRSSDDVFHVGFDVPYGELSTMVVQPSDTMDKPVLVYTNEVSETYVFNWSEQEFERVSPTWPIRQR
jgi:hypothetical protein